MPISRTKNNEFFRTWNSKMAYLLGYFAADGAMIRNKRGAHYIEFTSIDKQLIQNVKKFIQTDLKISKCIRSHTWRNVYRIQIGSKNMYSDLEELGFSPNKSKSLRMPVVPKKYLPFFVRGYFDGDGCVHFNYYKRTNRNNQFYGHLHVTFVSGSEKFLQALKEKLQQEANLIGGTLYYAQGYRLSYSKHDSLRLFDFMYGGRELDIILKRKFKYFQRTINTIHCELLRSGPVA